MTKFTPVELVVLLRCHYEADGPSNNDSPAVAKALSRWEGLGCVRYEDYHWEITQKGRAMVGMICQTPLPEQVWADPRATTVEIGGKFYHRIEESRCPHTLIECVDGIERCVECGSEDV